MSSGVARGRRRTAVWGLVLSSVLQATLVFLGIGFVLAVENLSSAVILFAWCCVGTAYAAGIWVLLWLAGRRAESDAPPLLMELGIVPRTISLTATIFTSAVGVAATVQHIFLEPDDAITPVLNVIGIWAMLLAWILLHWGYAQLYLQLYYREDDRPLRFPGTSTPGILEFAYFSYTVAVSFAASDVEVHDRRMRWRVMTHSVIGYFVNGLIIVTALSAIAEAGGR
ncbi:DUF1345 domain-containing protein [Microbacterium invictum]|uniref:DUF1345 domain-containing protein n=1 Tax=Microbacterium invictum TaxID=515415 RepID=A0ABZ0VF09_9MICO|nr:DUF1345 domain-containing protein [Microbacterium invictum]WQB71432.1 DUF1345 domain-containing protein [Microbacterium invictum]